MLAKVNYVLYRLTCNNKLYSEIRVLGRSFPAAKVSFDRSNRIDAAMVLIGNKDKLLYYNFC